MTRTRRSDLGQQVYTYTPRTLRLVCFFCAFLLTTGLAIILWRAPGAPKDQGYNTANVVGLVTIWLILLFILERFARARISIHQGGLLVRNFFVTYCLVWPQVIEIDYGANDSWASLDLANAGRLTVLALARSEGIGTAEFVELVRAHIRGHEAEEPNI